MSDELDIPGVLALEKAIREERFPHCLDARIWLAEWKQAIAANSTLPTDDGAMIGWFANAIMAGYDNAIRRGSIPSAPPHPA